MASSPDPKAVKEATKLMKSADSEYKGGFLRKPDFPSAGSNYQKAYEIFMKQKMYKEAKIAGEKGGMAYDQANLSLKSGQNFANSASAAFYLNEFSEVVRLLQESKVRYLEGDQPMAIARIMKELAKKIKAADPECAYQIYNDLLTLVEDSENYHWEKETFIDFAILALEMGKIPEVFDCWNRAKKAFLFLKNYDAAAHCVVSSIAIHLKRGDVVAAQNTLDEAMQDDYFIRTEDFSMIDLIVRGVKNNDGDLIELGQKNVIIQFLKPEIAKILCSFKGPKSAPKEKETPSKGGAPVPQPPQEEEDDEPDLL